MDKELGPALENPRPRIQVQSGLHSKTVSKKSSNVDLILEDSTLGFFPPFNGNAFSTGYMCIVCFFPCM